MTHLGRERRWWYEAEDRARGVHRGRMVHARSDSMGSVHTEEVLIPESRFPSGQVPPSAEPVEEAAAGTETTPLPPAAAFLEGYSLVDIEFMCLKALGEMG